MRKHTIAHSLLMITSVLASGPFHVMRRQKDTVTAPTTPTTSAQATAAQSSPASTSPTAATSNPIISSSTALLSSSSVASSASVTAISTSTLSTPTQTTPTSTLSSTPVGSSSSSPLTSASSISETTSASTSTNAQGSLVTVIVTNPLSATSSPSPSATSASQDTSSHSGTIIGLSVAGGVTAVAVIAFIIWKLTRKRFSDLDDPDEAIKWPELNQTHTNAGNDELSPQTSITYSANAISRNVSTFDHAEHLDPYAVPPLPQFNPNQPYRDDPHASASAGYYDPYRGPIPQTFNDGSVDGHENIQMSTYPPSSRSRSPGPGMAYDMRGRGSPAPGGVSPALGPTHDTGGRDFPAPGRTISPGPASALGLDRRP